MKVSLVTPCFNEEEGIVKCVEKIRNIMEKSNFEYEHIISDNNSTDNTWSILQKLASQDSNVKLLRNSRNVGPTRNTWSALKFASGDAIIPFVPADLQDPPEKIPELIEKWQEGFDVVFGVRSIRKEPFLLKIARRIFYFLYYKIVDTNIPKHAGEFLIADRKVIEKVIESQEEKPYIRGLIASNATKTSSVPYTWNKRTTGISKNGLWQLADEAINAFTSNSLHLGRLVLISGVIFSMASLIFALISVVWFAITSSDIPRGIPILIILFLLVSSYQMILLGVVAEYTLSIKKGMTKANPVTILEKINF